MSLMSDIGAVIKTRFDRNASAMTKVQFNALAEERKANRAGSGFDEMGKHPNSALLPTAVAINEGMWCTSSTINTLKLGYENTTSSYVLGNSKTTSPYVSINGCKIKVANINQTSNSISDILLPPAPNIYPYNTVLTAEQIASGVIKHADASNSGLITNGRFYADTSGWSESIAGSISWNSGSLSFTSAGGNRYAYQAISCVIGKEYVVEFNGKCSDQYGTLSVATTTAFGTPIVNFALVDNSANMDKYTFKFTATATTMYIRPKMGGVNSIAYYDNIAVYPADAISRSDLVFLESWHEDISEKNIVYPLGNVQYLGGNTDGLTGIVNGSFTGFETYSLFGNWQTPSALVGKGYVWSSLTEAQRKAFIANPDNNCYLDGDKVIQVRYRIRVVQGLGDSWVSINNLAAEISAPGYGTALRYSSINSYVASKGKKTAIQSDLSTSNDYLTYGYTATNRDLGTWSTAGFLAGSYNGQCFALPIALVHR